MSPDPFKDFHEENALAYLNVPVNILDEKEMNPSSRLSHKT